jgi:hypothetical protein
VQLPSLLTQHLNHWLGEWPSTHEGLTIVGSPHRTEPSWDGSIHDVLGVTTPTGGVLSVPPQAVETIRALIKGQNLEEDMQLLRANNAAMGEAVGRKGKLGAGFFRWSDSPTSTPDVGEWVPREDPRIPEWLKPFNGDGVGRRWELWCRRGFEET